MKHSDEHNIRMAAKKIVRDRMYESMRYDTYVRANLGKDHPDFGMSPLEHALANAERESEKSS